MSKYFHWFSLILYLMLIPAVSLTADSGIVQNLLLSGNELISDRQILGVMETQVGTNYDANILTGDFDRIVTLYEEKGLPFARIDTERMLIKCFPDGIYLHIHIDEGTIGKVIVSGNSRTREKVIVRELLLQVGEVYTVEDELESERILRRKPYLGNAEIEAIWDEAIMGVRVDVFVEDLWTIIPALDLPAFSNGSTDFLLSIDDSNFFGSGNHVGLRYQIINEDGEDARSLIRSRYTMPRLFDSQWEFDGRYTQKQEGDSWQVGLSLPQHSLKNRWSADIRTAELSDELRWYERGEKTDVYRRSQQLSSGQVTRYFGDRHEQTQVSLWGISRWSKFNRVEKLLPSSADFEDRNTKMLGVSLGRRRVDFMRTRFLNKMGRVEDIGVGYAYSVSLGYASPFYGADRSETNLNLQYSLLQAYQDRFFIFVNSGVTTRMSPQKVEDSVLDASVKVVGKNLFHQTLAAQLSTTMAFGLEGQSQVILGGLNGLRGYSSREFSGEKMVLLNLESRMFFRGGIFEKLENLALLGRGIGIVFGSAIFADLGYIWAGDGFDLREMKRSVGVGLRVAIPKLRGSPVYRFDLAFPLDVPGDASFSQVLTFGLGHVF